ncbi:serpin B [Butyrivibrio fibrisolvens DSM 3071]|uniref:Serpin B n=1 Tax=Butyrivibrio fibrisolvens DSM 3071 TaxID=1121131 RepID=A0A1M5YYN3_BUTFI|nr:serpin family protein [Butyrivibrio fibrisolvens]SHI17060.1 serpin B [Butyrivibrio fibrisolvens DSM 3071]
MKKRIVSTLLSIVTVSNLITGCSSPDIRTASGAPNSSGISNAPDITNEYNPSNVSAETLASSNADFNSALISYIEQNGFAEENYMISPTSYRAAMALAIVGADNATKEELLHAMGFNDMNELVAWYVSVTESVDKYNEWLKDAQKDFKENREDYGDGASKPSGVFDLENSIWRNTTNATGELSQDYMDYVAKNFNAAANNVSSDKITNAVNDWIDENTDGLIRSISDDLSASDLILINTLYLKASWKNDFDEYCTEEGDFTTIFGDTVSKDFMNQQEEFLYYEDDDCKFVVLPMNGGINAVFILGDATGVMDKMSEASYEDVAVSIPKFVTETSFSQNELIGFCMDRGATSAFNEDADFSIMSDEMDLFITDIIQKTKIDVDEKGVRAAAATAIIMKAGCAEIEEVKEFTADQPFTYMILTDSETPELLFYGQLVK